MENFYVELNNKKIPFHYEKVLDKIPRLVIGPFSGKNTDYSESTIPILLDILEICEKNKKMNVAYSQKPEDEESFKLCLHIYNMEQDEWYKKGFYEKVQFCEHEENIYFNEDDILYFQNNSFEEPDIFFGRIYHQEMFNKNKYFKELIEKTWHPRRVIDWCLTHEDL